MSIKSVKNLSIANRRVLLRVDLNVSTDNGKILNDFKIKQIIPTINYILDQGCTIILITHLGRPNGYDANLSTRIFLPWFTHHNYTIEYAATVEDVHTLTAPIIMLENIRFFPGEQTNNSALASQFAKQLASLASIYINDAFGLLHRTDTSITILADQFDAEHKGCGLLIEAELHAFNAILDAPKHPFLLILGGAKASTKIPIIKSIIINMKHTVDAILLCPAIAFTFLDAMGKSVGKSKVEKSMHDQCLEIMQLARQHNIAVLFACDYVVAQQTIDGQLSTTLTSSINSDEVGISIGPKTIELFSQYIHNAHTIFFNGAIGFLQRPDTLQGMHQIFNAMAHSHANTIIAGGDSVAAAYHFSLADQIKHISTGGGSALSYLAGEQLPGLEALKQRTKT